MTGSCAQYIEAPTHHTGSGTPSVFLAGGITDCPDWQSQAVALLGSLSIVIFNPRRADFPIHDPGAASEQINWEFTHLSRAQVILFWFPDSGPTPQPIALYELGRHVALGHRVAVGADPAYVRRADVLIQLGLARPDCQVRATLEDACADVAEHVT